MTEEEPKRRRPVHESLVREDLPPCKFFLSTGSTLLDLAISGRCPGGVGSGRITQIYGDESTAKTLLCQEILGSAQRAGGSVVFEDAEHTLDFGRAELLFGLETGRWQNEEKQAEFLPKPLAEAVEEFPAFTYRTPDTIEELFDDEIGAAIKLLKEKKLASPACMGVDSLSALPSKAELEGKDGKAVRLDDPSMGTSRAKQFSAAFRKYIHPMAEQNLTVVAIDQTRTAVGVTFGPKDTTSGGKALAFYASTRILLHHAGNIKNKHEVVQGVKIRFKVTKNKIAPPFREGLIRVLFDYGIDDVTANLEWLKENGEGKDCLLKLEGAWYAWGEERLGNGLDAAVKAIEDKGMEEALRQEVVRVWNIMHEPASRKPRQR